MVYEATSKNIDELLQTDYAVVDFYGDHCGACVALAPVYNEAANDLAMIRFIKANVDKDRELGERFNVRALPTLLCFRNGELVYEDGGAKDMPMLHEMLAKLLY